MIRQECEKRIGEHLIEITKILVEFLPNDKEAHLSMAAFAEDDGIAWGFSFDENGEYVINGFYRGFLRKKEEEHA